ncbi:MAG: chromosomal replication initiator protein DnaA [Planctomycetota bacterium]
MVKEDSDIGRRVLSELKDLIGDRRYQTWFDGRVTIEASGETKLEVVVSSPLERECLQRQFFSEMKTATCLAGVGERKVAFRIDAGADDAADGSNAATQQPTPPKAKASKAAGHDVPAKSEPAKRQPVPAADDSAFARFVTSQQNAPAVSVAQQIAAGESVATPLLLWGPTGVGKTHLLNAIRQEVRRKKRRIRAIYLTAEQFTTGFVEAVHSRGLPSFRSKYRGVDLLLIDDLQFFAGKTKTLEELQHTIDTLLAEGGQIVFASDRPPTALRDLGSELISRINSGISLEIASPDYATRQQLVRQVAGEQEFQLSAEVADAIAANIAGGAREIRGVLNRLRIGAQLVGGEVTITRVQQLIDEINSQSIPRVQMADIQNAVCEVFGVDRGALRSNKRTKAVTEPRMVAMWLSRKYTRAAWSEIGAYYGRRSHSTVISACRRVDGLMNNEPGVRSATGDIALHDALRRIEVELRTG